MNSQTLRHLKKFEVDIVRAEVSSGSVELHHSRPRTTRTGLT